MSTDRLKRWFADLPIRSKLLLMDLTAGSLAVVILAISVVGYAWMSNRQALVENSAAQAHAVAENLASALLFQDQATAKEILGEFRLSPEVSAAAIYGLDGNLFLHYGAEDSVAALPARMAANYTHEFQGGRLHLAVPIEHKGQRYGSLLLLVDTGQMMHQIAAYVSGIIIAALLALLVGAGLIDVLNHFITGQLDRLTQVMQRISEDGDYSQRITGVDSGDEIGFLARNFNAMLERIELHDKALGVELNERRRAEEQLYRLAHSDTLTQLPNRQFFTQYLDEALAQVAALGGSLALMFIDLDNFKATNDNFGHQTGDALLRLAATRLRQAIRGEDIVCRLGGDEFAVVIRNFRETVQVKVISEKIIASLSQPFQIDGKDLFVGASVGIALAPEHARDSNDLVRCADTAMYRAKADGKNRYALWQPELGENLSRRYQMEALLRKAMERRELEVVFQPVHNMADKSLAGMEALLRWHSRELGAVMPAEFIPVAEECGLINDIGIWVMDQACRHLADWRRGHPRLFVAVNLSPRQFTDPKLADRIAAVIEAHGLPNNCVELEITESLVLDPSPTTLGNIARMRELGLPIALDDFGTGYSSLSYLGQFPISKIKIDRRFVASLGQDKNSTAIVNAIIGMGRSMGMQLHVEGIEGEAQLDWLRNAGCELGQGFHYSQPIGAAAATHYVATHPGGEKPARAFPLNPAISERD